MLYGIEYNTDSRDPQSVLRTFRSEAAALRWRDETKVDGEFPFAYADRESANNWHRRVRAVYEFGGRITERRIRDERAKWRGRSDAPYHTDDVKRLIVMSGGRGLR